MTNSLLQPMRIPFLILTPACVLLGISTAIWQNGRVNVWHTILILIGAIAAHISVNAFNEYFDFKSGLDALTQRTPFSGGSGALPANPELEKPTFALAWITFAITASVGIYFAYTWGWQILPLGFVGLFLLYAYTPWLSRNPFLCLVAPGLGFGILMVVGTHFALTGKFSMASFIASLIPFFLVNNLLLLNQFPDLDADGTIGRKHFPLLIGRRKSSLIYGIFLVLAYTMIVLGVVFDYMPISTLLGTLTLVIAVPAAIGAYRHADDIRKLASMLGMNVLLNIFTPILIAIGFFVS
jgi:1,4-dihydroxy-2-naphthoate octaprenyltransferase